MQESFEHLSSDGHENQLGSEDMVNNDKSKL